MDLNQLAIFVKVVDQGSFTKAAQALKKPKSRISRNIAALEKEVGAALLYRSTRQLSLTDAGTLLYKNAKEHVYGLEGATERVRENSSEVAGVIRMTAAEDVGAILFGNYVKELISRYPKLKVDLYFSNEYVDLVKEGLDLALRIGELKDTTLKAKRVGKVSSILVASQNYLKKAPRIETIRDIQDHPTLLFSNESEDDEWSLVKDGKRHRVKVKPICRANHPMALLDLALAGKGIGLIPEFLCLDQLEQKKLVRVLPEYSAIPSTVQFVWPSQKGQNPKLKACVDLGVEMLSKYFL